MVFLMVGFAALGQSKIDTVLAREHVNKAVLFERKGQFADAITFYNKAAEIYREKKLWDKFFRCKCYVASHLFLMKNLKESRNLSDSILRAVPTYWKKPKLVVALSYVTLGNVAGAQGQIQESRTYYQKAVPILKEYPNKRVKVTDMLVNIGLTYYRQKKYHRALEYYEAALLGNKTWNLYFNIGITYLMMEEYHLALNYVEQAKKKALKRLKKSHIYLMYINNILGIIYGRLALKEQSIGNHQEALGILKKRYSKDSLRLEFGSFYNDLGFSYQNAKDYRKAIQYYEKAFNIFLKHKYKSTYSVYVTLGQCHLELGKLPEAIEYFRKALKYDKEDNVNTILSGIGRYYYQNKQLDSASVYFDKVINDSKQNNTLFFKDKQNFVISITYKIKILTQLYLQTKKTIYLAQAKAEIKKYDQDVRKMMGFVRRRGDQLVLKSFIREFYQEAIRVNALALTPLKNTISLADAFYFFERAQSSILLSSINYSEAIKFAGLPDKLIKQERDVREEITYWKNQIISKPKKATQYQDSLFKYNRQYEALITTLEKDYPKYTQLKYQNKTVSVAEAQRRLDEQTVLLEYAFGQKQSYLMVITKTEINVVPIAANTKLKPLMNTYYEALANESRVKDFATASYNLYQALLKPAEKYLKGKKRLLVVAPSLESIPFEALIAKQAPVSASKTDDYSQLSYLIKQYQISYHYSTTLWHRGVQSKQKNTPRLLAFAPFSTGKSESVSTRTRKSADPLPESGIEVRKLFNLFNAKKLDAEIYLAKKATKQQFIAQAKDFSILHIASHSSASTKYADLAKIRFAPESDSSKIDGLLYSGEVYNLSLNADLLVLSSCESGVGKLVQGEGVLSLARSFLYAGARNIVFSLWDVNDTETRKLMTVFYNNFLNGQNYRTALQKAQQSRIKADKYLPPKHWAGFVMIGE